MRWDPGDEGAGASFYTKEASAMSSRRPGSASHRARPDPSAGPLPRAPGTEVEQVGVLEAQPTAPLAHIEL
ncbi:MAG: hypothetical protein ACYDB7_11025 [Mycobacteriales bacterium]